MEGGFAKGDKKVKKKAGAMTKLVRYDNIYIYVCVESLPEVTYVRTNGKYPNEERLRQ